MKNISHLILRLIQSGYLCPESGSALRSIFAKMSLGWDVAGEDVDKLISEISRADTANFILKDDDLRGKFLELAPDFAASLTLEQVRLNRKDYYQQSQKVFYLYMKLCERYHFERAFC